MKARLAASAAVAAVISLAFAPIAGASTDSPVTFTTTSVGGRTLAVATGPAFAPQNLVLAQSADSTTDAVTTVAEVFAASNDWSVTAELCGLVDPEAVGTGVKDCTRHVLDRNSADPATIPGSSIVPTTANVAGFPLNGGGTTTSPTSADMSDVITVLNNTGKTAGETFNGTYSVSTNLQIQNLTQEGTWRGFWVVTAYL